MATSLRERPVMAELADQQMIYCFTYDVARGRQVRMYRNVVVISREAGGE